MIQTRRDILGKVARKIVSPRELYRYLKFKLVSGDEYPYLDFTDAFPRTAAIMGKITPCKLDIDNPVFIAGLRRSGSTLFYRLMNAHTDLFLFNERFPGDRMHGRGMPTTNNIYYTIEDTDKFRQTALRYLSPAIRRNYHHWGCKLSLELAHPDPGSIAYPTMEKIISAFPDAKVIGLTRDPRDFVLSAISRGGHDVRWWIREYQAMMTLFRNLGESYPDTFMTVRYEDLVEHPEETVRKCCQFAGIPFQEDMLDASKWSVKGPREYASSGIVASLDKWRHAEGKNLDIVREVTNACFPGALRYGYAAD